MTDRSGTVHVALLAVPLAWRRGAAADQIAQKCGKDATT